MGHSVHFVAQLVLPRNLPTEVLDVLKIMTADVDQEVRIPSRHELPAHVFFDHEKWWNTLHERRDWPHVETHRPKLTEEIAMDTDETPVYTIFAAGSPKNGWSRLPLFAEWIATYLLEEVNDMPFLVLQDDVEPTYFEGVVKAYYVENGKAVSFDRKWGLLDVDDTHSYEDPTYLE